jgi:tetratricopeptide (TPR) repeat protein
MIMAASLDRKELLALYEARGDEGTYDQARPLFEAALENEASPDLLMDYGYLLQCHGRVALREAVAQYERAIELDPGADKARYQLISARAALGDTDQEIDVYKRRVAASPLDIRENRFLARAYLAAREFARAFEVVESGLRLDSDDAILIDCRAEARAGLGDTEGALADYRKALELDKDSIGPLYMSAFLLERKGRVQEAIQHWRSIIEWSEARGFTLDTEWPKREIERLSEMANG